MRLGDHTRPARRPGLSPLNLLSHGIFGKAPNPTESRTPDSSRLWRKWQKPTHYHYTKVAFITPFQSSPKIGIYSSLKRYFFGSNYLPIDHIAEY